ncbi:phosphodiester glycosidase family protein [Flavobacterium sp.]|uniref:phosphodiester glycosidase family protein n=1 Tax=Flavobacterium sp. TaxID=239 RepID=UPI00261C809C|nr:phosphodiester glycosidase family protein [Flavobacterium sp.]
MFWKDEKGTRLGNFTNLKNHLARNKTKLLFATNAGMFNKSFAPQGLYIEKNKVLKEIDTNNGNENFYLKPNGVFYITNTNEAIVCNTTDFQTTTTVKYATQSGPLLVHKGKIHAAFNQNSTNLNVRNGVGVLPNGHVVFAMSKSPINFYEFAKYFLDLGCKEALYLDGFVSRTYLPEKKWVQTDGNFGVMIGVTSKS